MHLGQKSQRIISSLGVKSSTPYLSLGVKSYSPQLDVDSLIKNHTPDGIIRNESNSNNIVAFHLPPPDYKNSPPNSASNPPAPRRRFLRQNIRTL